MRLNGSLTIEEFILAFNKYMRIYCARHGWRLPELDVYEIIIIEISAVYRPKFYEYHNPVGNLHHIINLMEKFRSRAASKL